MDCFSPNDRSIIMSRIKGRDTKIEVLLRRFLFSLGYRFRKNDKRYPGHPDIILPKYRVAVYVNGCFWHGHDCTLNRGVKSNVEFWNEKIKKNKARDERNHEAMMALGFRVIVVWECAIRLSRDVPSFLLSFEEEIREGRNGYVEFPIINSSSDCS